jgi:hypothetical protein
MIRMVVIPAGSLLLAVIFGSASPAAADVAPSVRTQSGKVRCYVATDQRMQPGPDVICQTGGPDSIGFLQAPVDRGRHYDISIVDGAGAFRWDNGNIPWTSDALASDIVLEYGHTYHLQGWMIDGSSDGTKFTNDATGHGMFVSVGNVYAF